jgi:hypothetical protein
VAGGADAMSSTPKKPASRRRSAFPITTRKPARPVPPPMPPETDEEQRHSKEMIRKMEELIRQLQARNLANAVLLAQQAAAGRGVLVEHFAELGRRFGHTLNQPPKSRARLKVIPGGAA